MSATQRDAHDDDGGGSPDSGAAPSSPQSSPPSGPRQTIVAFPDGPLLVRGDFDIVDPDGRPLRRSRKTVALCRCGASVLKPYCDGSHKLIGFKTEPES